MARRRSRSYRRRWLRRLWLIAGLIVLTALLYLLVSYWYEIHKVPPPQIAVPDTWDAPE